MTGRADRKVGVARALTLAVAVALAVGSLVVAAASGSWPDHDRITVALTVIAIAVGELARMRFGHGREWAPVTMAAGTALALGIGIADDQLPPPTSLVIFGTTVGLVSGLLVRRLLRWGVGYADASARLVAISLAAFVFRAMGVTQADVHGTQLDRWTVAGQLLAASAVAVLAEHLIILALRVEDDWSRRLSVLTEGRLATTLLIIGQLTVPPLVFLTQRLLGPAALPLFLAPAFITLVASRRYDQARATLEQTVAALAALPERSGHVFPGHAERVAARAVLMGRDLHLLERDLLVLQQAALLHDIGQVALSSPIPGGATVLAAPADQRRIAEDSVRIVQQAGLQEEVSGAIRGSVVPFRQMRELGEPIPIMGRIIKVANAFDDLTHGEGTPQAAAAALERINLGLGYEYDPVCVEALARTTTADRAEARSAAVG